MVKVLPDTEALVTSELDWPAAVARATVAPALARKTLEPSLMVWSATCSWSSSSEGSTWLVEAGACIWASESLWPDWTSEADWLSVSQSLMVSEPAGSDWLDWLASSTDWFCPFWLLSSRVLVEAGWLVFSTDLDESCVSVAVADESVETEASSLLAPVCG